MDLVIDQRRQRHTVRNAALEMIRIRHPQGTATFKLDEQHSTLGSLQSFIAEQSGIAPGDQVLKIGYPPQSVSLGSAHAETLLGAEGIGIKKGEQVIVARRAGSTDFGSAASLASGYQPPTSSHSTSSFSPLNAPKPVVSTATGPRAASLGAPTLSDGLTARTPPTAPESSPASSAPRPSSNTTSISSSSKATEIEDGAVSVTVAGEQGHLTLKVVPDDNSCLFNSIGFLFEQRLGADVCQGLRSTVAEAIRADPDRYPDVVLGQPREAYIRKILTPQTWGGGIELSILSAHFGVEIDSIDVATGTIHRFGEDVGYPNRGIVIYSGIHYDAVALLPTPSSPIENGTTLFPSPSAFGIPIDEDPILHAAKQLCKQLKEKRYYTDTATFALKCRSCGSKLTGEKEAIEHAKSTGHGDFGEV